MSGERDELVAELRRIATSLRSGGGVGHEIARLESLADRLLADRRASRSSPEVTPGPGVVEYTKFVRDFQTRVLGYAAVTLEGETVLAIGERREALKPNIDGPYLTVALVRQLPAALAVPRADAGGGEPSEEVLRIAERLRNCLPNFVGTEPVTAKCATLDDAPDHVATVAELFALAEFVLAARASRDGERGR